eukprot:1185924-Prorocentrum_minimum.AAC.3
MSGLEVVFVGAKMCLETSAEVLQVGGHGALAVDDRHGGGVVGQPEHSLVGPALLGLVSQHPLDPCVELAVVAAREGGAQLLGVRLRESVVVSMATTCCARGVGHEHGDICMRGVGAQELVRAGLRVAGEEAILAGQAVQVVSASGVTKKVSKLSEVLQRLVRDHHVRRVLPVQGRRAMWGSLVT